MERYESNKSDADRAPLEDARPHEGEHDRRRRDSDSRQESGRRERAARLDETRERVNDTSTEAQKSHALPDGRRYDPTQPNPFWEEQEEFLTPHDRFMGNAAGKIEGGWKFMKNAKRKTTNFLRPLMFMENPDRAKKTLDEYDSLVSKGRATVINEQTGVSYHDYRMAQRAYKKTGNFKNYYFRMVGAYDNRGVFSGRVKTYRIERSKEEE